MECVKISDQKVNDLFSVIMNQVRSCHAVRPATLLKGTDTESRRSGHADRRTNFFETAIARQSMGHLYFRLKKQNRLINDECMLAWIVLKSQVLACCAVKTTTHLSASNQHVPIS